MFDAEELKKLDREYFEVIRADEVDVTVISKNTRHIWLIHNTDYPNDGCCIIFHAHKPAGIPYHQHGRVRSLRQAIKSIKGHDRWQMQGRPKMTQRGYE